MKAVKRGTLLMVLWGISPVLCGAQSGVDPVEWTTLVSGPLKADHTCENFRCVVVNGDETTIRGSIEFHDRRGRIRKSAAFEIGPGEVASVDHGPPQRYATRHCRVHAGRDPGFRPLVEGKPFEIVASLEMYNCSGSRYLTTPLKRITATSCGDENACTTDWFDPVAGVCVHDAYTCEVDDNPCTENVCKPVWETMQTKYEILKPVCERFVGGQAAPLANLSVPGPMEPNVNIFLSSALHATDNSRGFRCDLVNSSDSAVFGRLKLLTQSGKVVKTRKFELEPGKVFSLSKRSFRNWSGYCRAEVQQYPPDGTTGESTEPTQIDVAGTFHLESWAGRSITTTPLELISMGCDDGSACTLDSFDEVAGRCLHEPVCPVDAVCHNIPEQRITTYKIVRPVCEQRTFCQPDD